MSKKTTEHAASVLKEIMAGLNPDVIKDYEMPTLCNMETARETGFAVILTLSTKFDYTSAVLDDWLRKQMMKDAVDGEIVSVNTRLGQMFIAKSEKLNDDKYKWGDKIKLIIIKNQ